MSATRGERFVLWMAGHSPRVLLEQPERVLINVASVLIAVSALLPPQPGSVLSTWPIVGRIIWAVFMLVGGVTSLYGATTGSRMADRTGAMMIGGASLFFATQIFAVIGLRGVITGLIFVGIAIAKAFRFLRSAAVRIRIHQRLLEVKDRQDEEGSL